jgi:hypothetical protein
MTPMGNSITNEIISAVSALNTTPDYPKRLVTSSYLSEQIPMVAHAIEHLNSALRILNDTTMAARKTNSSI